MYTIQKLGATSDGSNGYKSIYGMIDVYKRQGRHHAALVSKSVNRQMGLSPKEQKKTIYE